LTGNWPSEVGDATGDLRCRRNPRAGRTPYYAIHSRLGPERVVPNVLEAVSDAHQEDLDLGLAEHV
jgi:hypothetical protein